MKIVWSPLALERVEDIAQYIAQDNASAAVKWVEGIFDSVERLADFPDERTSHQGADIWNVSNHLQCQRPSRYSDSKAEQSIIANVRTR